jgi:capsule assembly protein Wzi
MCVAVPLVALLVALPAASAQTSGSTGKAGSAQQRSPAPSAGIAYPTSHESDQLRLAQLAGDTSHLAAYMLRSPSMVLFGDTTRLPRARSLTWLHPDLHLTSNSGLPLSLNEGGMWAGRGVGVRLTGGVEFTVGRLRGVIAPEFWGASNARFDRISTGGGFFFPSPTVDEKRFGNGFANFWYVAPYSADLPWRFGSASMSRLIPGQSGVWYNAGPVEIGATTENMWWGPGIRNAIVMSDNAAGIPRLEIRTPRPWSTRVGSFEAHWFVGALSESQYFDTTRTDDVRSLSAAAVTWQPAFQRTLTLGVTRAVYATSNGYGSVPFRWFDVFANTGHPANHLPSDSSLTPGGRDQLFSLFARWVFPSDGFEAYTEWSRQELPTSLHDFIVDPTHSHGYTLGLQYRRPGPLDRPTFRVQGEVTTLEQSGDFKNQPVGVFYTSRRVIQGYTQLGLPIGASFGPGGSSQWLAWDRIWPSASLGVTFNRIRWNEDVRSTFGWPAYLADCNHDVSIIPGVRGGHDLGGGYMSASVMLGDRMNYDFQNISGCQGPARIDVHNTSVSISFSPFK